MPFGVIAEDEEQDAFAEEKEDKFDSEVFPLPVSRPRTRAASRAAPEILFPSGPVSMAPSSFDDSLLHAQRKSINRKRSMRKQSGRKKSLDDFAELPHRRIWNSTSSLFVATSMVKPDVSRSIRSLSSLVFAKLDPICFGATEFDEPAFEPESITAGVATFSRSREPPLDKHRLFGYALNVFVDAQLVNECIVMALVYIEKLLLATEMKVTYKNIRPMILAAFMLASKVWDDISMWNGDFAEIYPSFPIEFVNFWEKTLLNALSFDVFVSSAQ
jgi:hypothetical protein